MTYLVTGGAGFIGSHLVERLLEGGHRVLCLDDFNTFYDPKIKRTNLKKASLHANFRLVEGNILDLPLLEKIFSENSVQVIVHLAARAGVRPSIQEPLLYQEVNVRGTMNLLEMAVKHQVEKFIFASSSSVYGENKKVPFSETDNVDHPISPYAATKKAGELICYTYHHLYGLPITCLRFFTVYGPRQRPDMAIHKFTRLIDTGHHVPLYGDGRSQRDYTYISDALDGILKAIEKGQGYRVYNLGESKTIALLDLIRLIEQALGKKARIDWQPPQPGDMPITYADIVRARDELGYNPRVSIEEGIRRFVAWYREQVQP